MERTDTKPACREEMHHQADNAPVRWRGWVITFVILLILYPLSLGPVVYFDIRGSAPSLTETAMDTVYLPLVSFSLSGATFANTYKNYLDWWLVKGIDANVKEAWNSYPGP